MFHHFLYIRISSTSSTPVSLCVSPLVTATFRLVVFAFEKKISAASPGTGVLLESGMNHIYDHEHSHRPREADALWLEKSLLRAGVGSEFSWKGFPPRCGGSAYKGMRALFSSFVGKVH